MERNGRTLRLTVAQAVIRYLANQYSSVDGRRQRFVPIAAGIFGHGNVAGFSEALRHHSAELPFIQGRNEQALAHMATAFAKANRRERTLAVTASIGPGAMNLVTAASLATVNRLPLLLLPGDTYATRRQGPVLQQLENPSAPEVTVNDAFRPVSRFFDRITRPEQLLTALPQAFRVLANPVETGAVVLSLPQDVQSHAYDFPEEFFAPRVWKIRRTQPDPEEIAEVAAAIHTAKSPIIIAGGGVLYSRAEEELAALAESTGIPVCETFGGKGAVQLRRPWQLGGIGLEGNPATNELVRQADLVIHVGTRLTDFATGSQSIFAHPDVRFASVNIAEFDAVKQGAAAVVADARLALEALTKAVGDYAVPAEWRQEIAARKDRWTEVRAQALDHTTPVDASDCPPTDAVLSQGQLIGVLQDHAQKGDTIIAAAGGPPGDLLKVWDATEGRHCHLEFGFSCMGYEIPAALGVRLADPDPSHRVTTFIGDGTFLLNPTEILTASQERLPVTFVISENHGYQVIRRLQMMTFGTQYGNEFLYREGSVLDGATDYTEDYLDVDLAAIARGLGARTIRARSAEDVAAALESTRHETGPVAIVVPTVPHCDLPSAGVFWDVAPAETSEQPTVAPLRANYEDGLTAQRWHG